MPDTRFRPRLEEIEDRTTPAVAAADVNFAISTVAAQAGVIRYYSENFDLLTSISTQANVQASSQVIEAVSTNAINALGQFIADIQTRVAADPASAGALGGVLAQAQAAQGQAVSNLVVARNFDQFITNNPARVFATSSGGGTGTGTNNGTTNTNQFLFGTGNTTSPSTNNTTGTTNTTGGTGTTTGGTTNTGGTGTTTGGTTGGNSGGTTGTTTGGSGTGGVNDPSTGTGV